MIGAWETRDLRFSLHTCPHHLHCTWLGCIKSCIKDPNYRFLTEWWVLLGWFSHGECIMVCVAYWIGSTVNHDVRLSVVMIHQTTILHGLSTLRESWACAKINRRLWHMGETLMWSYILMDWVTIDEGWCKQIFSIKTPWYLMVLRQCVPLSDPKDMWSRKLLS